MSTIADMLNKETNINRRMIDATRKIFKLVEPMLEYEEKKKAGWETQKLGDIYVKNRTKMKKPLQELLSYEVTYNSYEKYIADKNYLHIIEDAFRFHKEYFISIEFKNNALRLQPRPMFCESERAAKKEMKEHFNRIMKKDPLWAKMFFSKQLRDVNIQAFYVFRDWLLNDFDTLIDTIEPLRQEYIISRYGQVEESDVDSYLLEKFPNEYVFYNNDILIRPYISYLYYPNLKI